MLPDILLGSNNCPSFPVGNVCRLCSESLMVHAVQALSLLFRRSHGALTPQRSISRWHSLCHPLGLCSLDALDLSRHLCSVLSELFDSELCELCELNVG